MSRSLAAVRVLARHPCPALRRPLSDSPSGVADKISKLSETERAQFAKHLEMMDVEWQSKLEHQVDAYRQMPTYSNDRGYINRVLTFCRVPKGEPREKLIWRSSVAATFLGSMVAGKPIEKLEEAAPTMLSYFVEYMDEDWLFVTLPSYAARSLALKLCGGGK